MPPVGPAADGRQGSEVSVRGSGSESGMREMGGMGSDRRGHWSGPWADVGFRL